MSLTSLYEKNTTFCKAILKKKVTATLLTNNRASLFLR